MDVENLDIKELGDNVYWCPECQIPLLTENCYNCNSVGKYCGSSLRPVFRKERLFLQRKLKESLNKKITLPPELFSARSRVVFKGKTLFSYGVEDNHLKFKNVNLEYSNGNQIEDSTIERYNKLIEGNAPVLEALENESIEFTKRTADKYPNHKKYISFSGGKDSLVTAMIVKKAIGKTPLFFIDTTLEFPDTLKFVEMFSKKYDFDVVSERSHNDFFETCKKLDPPSHLMRWCCSVIKAYPVNKFLENEKGNILTFDGIRKVESSKRGKYPRIYKNKKISRQILARSIFHWPTLAIWLYILKNKLIFNQAYEKGYNRVGCYICPFNSKYDEILLKFFYPAEFSKWEGVLIDYAIKNNKGRDLNWVNGGYWKKRKPSRNKIITVIEEIESNKQKIMYKFRENSITEQSLEFLKPFGEINFYDHNFFEINGKHPFKISGFIGGTQIVVDFDKESNVKIRNLLKRQINKSLNCVGCGGCVGTCINHAISVNGGFSINKERCSSCLKCVSSKFTNYGCVALSFKGQTFRVGTKEEYSIF